MEILNNNFYILFQNGLAIFGFIILSIWLIKWISQFTIKTRELSEIDKDINNALRDALQDRSQYHENDKIYYKEHLATLKNDIEQFTSDIASKEKEITNCHHFIELIYIARMVIERQNANLNEHSKKHNDTLSSLFAVILNIYKLKNKNEDNLKTTLDSAFDRSDPPEQLEAQLLHYIFPLIQDSGLMELFGKASANILPDTLDIFVEQPNITPEALLEILQDNLTETDLAYRNKPNKSLNQIGAKDAPPS